MKKLIALVVCAALLAGCIVFGPRLYRLLSSKANATWISEKFSETLQEKQELVVLEKTITGQETVSTDAWLIGTVQQVQIPYTFTISFSVDMQEAEVAYDAENDVMQVALPRPAVAYYKLTVDEDSVETHDLLYPLTSDRYTQIKEELEQKLYNEAMADAELTQSAWDAAASETEAMYQSLLEANDGAASVSVEVVEKSE